MIARQSSGANRPLYPSASFRYRLAHCDAAVSPHARALYRKNRTEIEDGYDSFELAFSDYFSNWPGIRASFEQAEEAIAVRLEVAGGTNAAVGIIIQHFLTRFNSDHPGLGLVVEAEAAMEAPRPSYS